MHVKELSTEEKAERYDEVIEKFDVILNLDIVKESGTIFADDVRKILPELAEGEDERIRKYLSSFVELNSGVNLPPEDAKKILTWLERQREQKSAWKPSSEQMKFLWKYAEQNNYDGRILTSLYNDLKKLKG